VRSRSSLPTRASSVPRASASPLYFTRGVAR
jgi:hypothetical protein